MLGLYVHIPFCKSICGYCDFKKRVPKDNNQIKEYLKYLKLEYNNLDQKFDTIYIGGGTPSMLNLDDLKYLLDIFKGQNPIEYTIECNPESLDDEKINLLKEYKINRISLGVETFNNKLLKLIGRHHTKEMVFEVVNKLKKHFNNINIDLMFSIPGETIEDVLYDLESFIKLYVNHISYYSLILEENTPFYIKYMRDELKLNSIEEEANQYEFIINYLENKGFKQYEISNFAKANESIHNKIYWNYDNWIGIGLNASSKYKNRRYQNASRFNDYYNSKLEEDFILSNEDLLKENIIMSLRLKKGLNIKEINNKYNVDLLKMFKIDDLIELKLIKIEDGYLSLTHKGLMVANDVFERFL